MSKLIKNINENKTYLLGHFILYGIVTFICLYSGLVDLRTYWSIIIFYLPFYLLVSNIIYGLIKGFSFTFIFATFIFTCIFMFPFYFQNTSVLPFPLTLFYGIVYAVISTIFLFIGAGIRQIRLDNKATIKYN